MKKVFESKKSLALGAPVFIIGVLIIVLGVLNLKSLISPSASQTTKDEHKLFALGANSFGQLGKLPYDLESGKNAVEISEDITQIGAGRNFSLVVTKKGTLWSWGGNEWGQLGYDTPGTYYQASPQEIAGISNVQKIAVSNNHAVVLKDDGTVWAFGSNFSGQLGNGNNTDSAVPLEVQEITNIKEISAGYKFSVALKKDGTVWAWGASCDQSTKKAAEIWWKNTIGGMTSIDGGYYDPNSDSLVYYDKNEYCINEDIVGILSKTPVQIKGLSNITTISAGYGHVLALDSDGNVWSFGCNSFQQLGRKTAQKVENTTPQKIDGLENVMAVSSGYRHSLALTKDGKVWGWGLNSHGQLGVETKENMQMRPLEIPVDHVTEIIAGYDYTLVLKDDGTVWGWGMNRQKWFEDSEREFVANPVRVSDLEHIEKLAAGGGQILVLTKE